MNEVEMTLQLSRDRVRECADRFHARVFVLKHGELRIEELVSLAYGDVESEPISRG